MKPVISFSASLTDGGEIEIKMLTPLFLDITPETPGFNEAFLAIEALAKNGLEREKNRTGGRS